MTPAAALADPQFTRTLADAFPPADASEVKALVADAALRKLTKRPMLLPEQTGQDSVRQIAESVIRHVSSAKETKTEGIDMNTALKGRTPQERNDRITKDHTAEVISFALKAWGREKSAPIARVQQIAAVDRKTAEAWWHGKNPPQPHHLFTLARHIPELKAEVRRLLGLEQDHHESFQREAIALLQRYAR
jgi:hypothetical protein